LTIHNIHIIFKKIKTIEGERSSFSTWNWN